MLTIVVPKGEGFNEETQEYIYSKETTLSLEHSLVSISKWEAKWHRPFLDKSTKKNSEETIDYIRCMTITQNVDPNVFYLLSPENIKEIQDYIEDTRTATWFSDDKKKQGFPGKKRERTITSELIYYWMISLQIPFECQKWHINRLLTLIRVCNEENRADSNKKKGKRPSKEYLADRAALNAARRKQFNSKG